jgi:hypothetical protein
MGTVYKQNTCCRHNDGEILLMLVALNTKSAVQCYNIQMDTAHINTHTTP